MRARAASKARVGPSGQRLSTLQVGRALSRPHEGVGLGLSISRDLASTMGGALSVESTFGKGSTFTLTMERRAPLARKAG